jgi:hypothetical protein
MRVLIYILFSLISSTACAVDRGEAIEIAKKEFAFVWARDYSFMSAEIASIEASLATIDKDDDLEEKSEIKKISRFSHFYDDEEKTKNILKN